MTCYANLTSQCECRRCTTIKQHKAIQAYGAAGKEPILEPSHFAPTGQLKAYKCRVFGCDNSVLVPADTPPEANIPLCRDCQEQHDAHFAKVEAAELRKDSYWRGFLHGSLFSLITILALTGAILWLSR
jgi:hypothetical protein